MRQIADAHRLVGPYSAVTIPPFRQHARYCPPWHYTYGAGIAERAGRADHGGRSPEIAGGGRSEQPATARAVAVIEALERMALDSPPAGLPTAAADALASALPLADIPVCSSRELADPRCPVRAPDPARPIRWVRGVELPSGTPTFVPAVLVYTSHPQSEAEQLCVPISTGAAAGATWESAVTSGILEALERDIVSTLWLQRLALPRLPDSLLSPATRRLIAWCARKYLRVTLFDATTEVGIPTVYCVLEAPHDPAAERIVAACTKLDFDRAAAGALTEALYIRPAVHRSAENPAAAELLLRGAVWLGGPGGRGALDFLDEDPGPAAAGERAAAPPPGLDEAALLRWLVGRCREAGHRVYAVDITTPDLRDLGLRVAKAVIPSLQPLNFHPRAQYLGHPRLFTLPGLLGQRTLPENELNPHPQPFA